MNIEKYIENYENGKISIQEIADLEDRNQDTIHKYLQNYYKEQGKQLPKFGVPKEILDYFLKIGMTKEQIRENAAKRNIIILDNDFEAVYERRNKKRDKKANQESER